MTCRHRWLIDTPTPGVTYLAGVCRECGAEREFRAFPPEDYPGDGRNWMEKAARTRRTQPRVGRQGGDR